jgi:hypothetical protein
MKKYYMVHRVDGRCPSVKHDTLEAAFEEVKRLASSYPGIEFTVLETKYLVRVPWPTVSIMEIE